MPRLIQAGESLALRRRVRFMLVGTDGISAATGEAGGQPEISVDDAAWTSTGIGVLVAVGNGRYYAVLDASVCATPGTWVETRFKSGNTAECPGDSVLVVDYDPLEVTTVTELSDEALDQIVQAFAGASISIGSDDSNLTLESAVLTYMSSTEFLRRVDARVVRDLVSDTGERVSEASLSSNDNLTAILGDASAEFERACVKGGRYHSADIAAMMAASTIARNGVYRILTRLAMCMLWERRPDKGPIPEIYRTVLDELERLAIGERIFPFVEAMTAGHANHSQETAEEARARLGAVSRARRYFGKRARDYDSP